MTSIDAEPLPGTTLKDIIQEEELLKEFLGLLKKRFELDREYLEKLQALRASANPRWENSAIWPLISPFLHFLDEETRLREQTADSLFARLEDLPEHESPDKLDEDGVAASVKYGRLRPAYDKYQTCLSRVNTKESIASLQAWYQQKRVEDRWAGGMTAQDIAAYVFPEIDRDYRASVVAQQEDVQSAVQWHNKDLTAQLENQQQHTEEIKSLLSDVSTLYSQSSARLAQYSSTLMHSIAIFSSSHAIASFHDEQLREASHLLLQPVVYLNFYTDGLPAKPIFGLKISDEVVRNPVFAAEYDNEPLSIAEAFSIEKDPDVTPISFSHPYWSNSTFRRKAMILSFFTAPPLISLSKNILSLQYETWTRSKLKVVMREVSNEAKDIIYQWYLTLAGGLVQDATLLFHDPDAWGLVGAIRRKWDFDNNSPLPAGVIRGITLHPPPILLWKKTMQPYVPPKQ